MSGFAGVPDLIYNNSSRSSTFHVADTSIENWKKWQLHLISCPLVIAFSSRPQPRLNSDGTCDFSQLCIHVYLGRKPTNSEKVRYNLPELIEGYPVQYIDIATIGGISLVCKPENIERLLEVSFEPPTGWEALQYEPSMIPKDHRDRFDILVGGISIGHGCVTAGTLGGFVWDTKTREILGLTCAHVAAPPGAKVGDEIYQPGPLDIRKRFNREPNERDVCGHLLRWQEISFQKPNLIDAAVFSLTRPAWPDYILGLGRIQLRRSH